MSRQRHRVDVTTDGAGNFSGAVASASGYVQRARYVPDGSVPLTAAIRRLPAQRRAADHVRDRHRHIGDFLELR